MGGFHPAIWPGWPVACHAQLSIMAAAETMEWDGLDPYSRAVSSAFERTGPAVANVGAGAGRRSARGSGVLFTPDGYLLTNSHVIKGAAGLAASLHNGREYAAMLVGDDPDTDLAVLRLVGDKFEHAVLGSSDRKS